MAKGEDKKLASLAKKNAAKAAKAKPNRRPQYGEPLPPEPHGHLELGAFIPGRSPGGRGFPPAPAEGCRRNGAGDWA